MSQVDVSRRFRRGGRDAGAEIGAAMSLVPVERTGRRQFVTSNSADKMGLGA